MANDARCSITLEPGGQFELSGAPLETVHQTCDEVHEHLRQVREVCDDLGLGPRVLRAETAALAAVAVFQAIAGDWRRVRIR